MPDIIYQSTVWAQFEFIGFHRWPDAREVLPERGYLADLHRHKFFVRVETSVDYPDREVEFHDLRDNAEAFVTLEVAGRNWTPEMSCEAMAAAILKWFTKAYSQRNFYSVTVSEDNENGATVTQRLSESA